MTTYEYATDEVRSQAQPRVVPRSLGKIAVSWLTTTDHKVLGYMYLITSFVFFCIGCKRCRGSGRREVGG